MSIDRRHFLTASAALVLTGCSAPARAPSPVIATRGLPTDLRPSPNAAFDAWVAAFRSRSGVSGSTFDAAFASAGYLSGVVQRDGNQIQTRRTLEEYLSIATSDERIAKGRAAFLRHRTTLDAIEARYGVDALIVAAIWGMESTFGEKRGQIPVVSSTATLAFDGRRGDFYESQLRAALRILERGDTTPSQLTGSWAGAMGHTQFIPTSYQSFAVDFTGDGRRDIWGENPADALASTASYLARNGWRNGLKWGSETGTGGPDGRTIQPQAGGVRFTVTRNFNVLKTYNNSDLYALGVGYLADRIGGAGPLRGSFPPDENGLSRTDRIAIQRGLTARGYDIGTIDGVVGTLTQNAIREFETSQGLPVRGIASREILARLR